MELKLEHLSYTYNPGTPFEKKALDDISLTIGEGEFIGLVGHTGSGKSTLVQHLNGLLMPSRGSVCADGRDIAGEGYPLRQHRFRVGVVFQYPEYQLFESDVLKDVSFGPKNQGLPDEEVLARAREAMRSVGLDESYETRSPFELSGGQKRRAAIAGILAMNPEMLVLDEPTAGMDPKGRDEILELLKRINQERNITIVLVSHSMEDVANYAERVIVIVDGKVRWDDSPSVVFSQIEELEQAGLRAPQVSYLLKELQDKGWDVDRSAVSIDAAAQEILKALSAPGLASERTMEEAGKGSGRVPETDSLHTEGDRPQV